MLSNLEADKGCPDPKLVDLVGCYVVHSVLYELECLQHGHLRIVGVVNRIPDVGLDHGENSKGCHAQYEDEAISYRLRVQLLTVVLSGVGRRIATALTLLALGGVFNH